MSPKVRILFQLRWCNGTACWTVAKQTGRAEFVTDLLAYIGLVPRELCTAVQLASPIPRYQCSAKALTWWSQRRPCPVQESPRGGHSGDQSLVPASMDYGASCSDTHRTHPHAWRPRERLFWMRMLRLWSWGSLTTLRLTVAVAGAYLFFPQLASHHLSYQTHWREGPAFLI